MSTNTAENKAAAVIAYAFPWPGWVMTNNYTHHTAPTQFVEAGSIRFAYRRFGAKLDIPLLFFMHLILVGTGPRSGEGMASLTPEGQEIFGANGYWFFGRPTIEELRQDLRVVLMRCRPDWDITTPELKAEWERSEHGRFYPYGKTYGQVFQEQE